MHLSTLSEWLTWIGSVHTVEIELGLDRVKEVAKRLGITTTCPIIMVAGTNGKGSTVAGLESIYYAASYQVGAFTSPILFHHSEQVRINGSNVADELFCAAFTNINQARGEISLSPFEFHTLAALLIMRRYPLDVWILEVGLGGRLDAVNIMDAEVAIVTSIDLDHMEWLGNTREAIAYEKAGIFRPGKPAICGDEEPPQSLIDHAEKIGAPLFCQNKDFSYREKAAGWEWSYQENNYLALPTPKLLLQNMSTVLMAVTLLQKVLPVSQVAIQQGLAEVNLPGRMQIIPGVVTKIYDVAHNPAGVKMLATQIQKMPKALKTYAVFSMLGDKDILKSVQAIQEQIDYWYVAPLATKRAASLVQLQEVFTQLKIKKVDFFESLPAAFAAAEAVAVKDDRVIIFGSFHVLTESSS